MSSQKKIIVTFIAVSLLLLGACRNVAEPPPLADSPLRLLATPLPPLPTPTLFGTSVDASGSDASASEALTESQPVASLPTIAPTPTEVVPFVSGQSGIAVAETVPQSWLQGLEGAAVEGEVQVVLGAGVPLGRWVYAVVVPLYSLTETATFAEVQGRWQGGGLVVSAETAAVFTQLWGEPNVQIIDDLNALENRLWEPDDVWGIVPFGALSAELKTLRIDGQSPLDRDFSLYAYPLSVPIGAVGDEAAAQQLQAQWQPLNWHASELTRVAMTGVTALVRATAFRMEANGILWPGEEVRDVLISADIAHLSNEVAFVDTCPYPSFYGGTSFCSDVRYFELFTDMGIDVVELTGNHVNDFGSAYLDDSIDMYEAAGMKYFGGGRNAQDAQTAAVFDHNGNRIVLLGCNPVGPNYAWAGTSSAGSRPCDAELKNQIRQHADSGAIVIVTLQYTEHYFYEPTYQQQQDFRSYIDAGATAVSGSQGHHAQGFDLYRGGFIHYGLGNLFFDQMDWLGTRQALIDEYVVYNNKLIGIEFTTGLIEDYARPRLMTAGERTDLFRTLFNVSTRD